MIEAVSRYGYPGVRLANLVALAGVSNTTFYEHFDSLRDCFLETYDEIVRRGIEQVHRAYGSEPGLRDGLHAAIEKYVDLAVEYPAAAHLVVVDSLNLGATGVARRQGTMEAYEFLFRGSLEQLGKNDRPSDLTVRAIVGGFHLVVYRRIRGRQSEQLRSDIDTLLDWGLSYRRAETSGVQLPQFESIAPEEGTPDHPELEDEQIWSRASAANRRGSSLSQRERMVRAAAVVVAKGGYGELTIAAITKGAGVSNETFYEQFSNPREAFEEALDALDRLALTRIKKAVNLQSTWPAAFVAGLDQLLAVYSENPAMSRLPMIEALCAGSVGLDRIDRMQDRLIAQFNFDKVPAKFGNPPPRVVIEAIAGGIDAVIQHEVEEDRARALPELLGELTTFALAPLKLQWGATSEDSNRKKH